MAWIKRNLFFFIGGLIAIGLLGAAAYYNYTSWSRNAANMAKLNETFQAIQALTAPGSSPGDKEHDRIAQAKKQEADARAWLKQAWGFFQPIPPIPADNPVTSEAFAASLRRTIDLLQHEATNANVGIPTGYGFSFEAERTHVTFAPASLDPLSTQLGEVKTIAEIMYSAGVNKLDAIQRVRTAEEDAQGGAGDYVTSQATTSGTASIIPYVITFRSFTPEIAQVFSGFADSPHGFIVKSINVAPAPSEDNGQTMNPPPSMRGQRFNENQNPVPEHGLVTVLKEKLLRIVMEVDIVKLPSKN